MESFNFEIVRNAAPLLMEGLRVTVVVSSSSFLMALALGTIVGIARANSERAKRLLGIYVEIFRGTPLLIQLFFIYYGLPSVGVKMSGYTAGIIGLGLNGGAYVSEIIRGALYSVGREQQDAASALGFSWLQAMIHVILPQSLRVAMPPLVNAFSGLLKESSLVSVLAITELTRVSQLIYTRTFRAFEVYLTVGALYFFMVYSVSRLSVRFERRFRLSHRPMDP